MNSEKLAIKLDGVPQTLLMPLLGRAKFSEKSYSPIHDPLAIKLVESINYNFDELLTRITRSLGFWMARAFHFDEAIKKFITKHPKGTIVNLGAGLETAFHRVDDGKLKWVDLDLPEVISLRNKLLPQSDRVNCIAKSILDFSWMNDIKEYGHEFFFFAGGLFMYFTEDEVKSIFIEMAKRFHQSELIFDSVTTRGIYYANKMLKEAKMSNAQLQWGLDDIRKLEAWSSNIQIVKHMPYFRDLDTKNFPIVLRIKMFFYDLHNKNAIMHLKFC